MIVNASDFGCHAIIVTQEGERARVVDLPGLDHHKAEDQARSISRLLRDVRLVGRPFPRREADRRELLDISAGYGT